MYVLWTLITFSLFLCNCHWFVQSQFMKLYSMFFIAEYKQIITCTQLLLLQSNYVDQPNVTSCTTKLTKPHLLIVVGMLLLFFAMHCGVFIPSFALSFQRKRKSLVKSKVFIVGLVVRRTASRKTAVETGLLKTLRENALICQVLILVRK